MRLLGFTGNPEVELPPRRGRLPRVLLAEENAEAYRDLITHLTSGHEALRPHRSGLIEGRTRVVLTGQQPALLGGPLYTLYKALTALEAARRLREVGCETIAAFWCASDDTDHGEVSSTAWPVPEGPPTRIRDESPADGERIGRLDMERMAPAIEALRGDWPGAETVLRLIDRFGKDSEGLNWTDFLREALWFFAGDEPLLFLDGDDPHLLEAAQPLLRRFLDERPQLAEAIENEGHPIRQRGGTPAIGATEALRCLFVRDAKGRRALEPEEREVDSASLLLPNVVLRPAVQEYLLPVDLVVCGEGEIDYRLLLGPVYERFGRPAARMMRRFSATLFPPTWSDDLEVPGAAETLEDPDAALQEWAKGELDPALLPGLEHARAEIGNDLGEMELPLSRVDRSLAQVLHSVASKVDFQLRRLEEALISKGKLALNRRHPELAHLREFLLPRGKLQERVFTLWTPLIWEGETSRKELDDAVRRWFDRGEFGHALISFERGGE